MSITNLNVVRSFYKGKPCIVGLSCAVYFSNTDTQDIYYVCHKKDFKDLNSEDKKTTIKGFKDQESEIYWYNKSKKCIDTLKEILPKYKRISYISCSPSKDELDFFKECPDIDVTVLETHESSKKELDSYDDIPKNVKIFHQKSFNQILGRSYTDKQYITNMDTLRLKFESILLYPVMQKTDLEFCITNDKKYPNRLLNEFYENTVCNTRDVAKYLKEHTDYVLEDNSYEEYPEKKINTIKELIKIYKVFKLDDCKVMLYDINLDDYGTFFEMLAMEEAKEHDYDFIMYLIPGTTYATLRTACLELCTVYFLKLLKEKNLNIVGDSDFYSGDIFIEDNTFNEYVSNNLLF